MILDLVSSHADYYLSITDLARRRFPVRGSAVVDPGCGLGDVASIRLCSHCNSYENPSLPCPIVESLSLASFMHCYVLLSPTDI